MMKAYTFATLAGGAPLAFVVTEDAVAGLLAAVVGGGGIFGIVKLWLAAAAQREERADARLDRILELGREEREVHHKETSALFDRMTTATEGLTNEVRGLRSDQRAGLACRLSDPKAQLSVAKPISKPDGTRGG